MNHLTKISLLGAVALLAAVGCQREELVDNPNYNPETKEVVTQFVMNVSTQGAAATKMSAEATQADPTSSTFVFRGIDNPVLYSYVKTGSAYKGILTKDENADKAYDLAEALSRGSISLNNSRRVLEMSLPLKTNVLLFYGKALQGDAYEGYKKDDCYGKLSSYTIGSTTDAVNVNLATRIDATGYTNLRTMENLIAGIMSMLLNTKLANGLAIDGSEAPDGVANTYKNDVTLTKDLSWNDYCKDDKSPIETTHVLYPLEIKLSTLYSRITTIRSGSFDAVTNPDGINEIRDGSGQAVLKMATDLLTVLNEVRCADPISDAETVAKYFAEKVYKRMLLYFTGSTNNTGAPVTGVAFNSHASIIANYALPAEVATRPTVTGSYGFTWPDATALAGLASYSPSLFPLDFDLPRGVAYICFDKTDGMFYYPQTFDISAMGGAATSTTNAQSYYYPAELLYFGNSPIRTTSADKEVKDYPAHAGTGTNPEVKYWGDESSWSGWTGNAVEAATRAVAMKYEICYGVAALETKVKYKSGLSNLKDNNHAVQTFWNTSLGPNDEPDKDIPIKEDGLKMTGLVIGGQSVKIGWDHLPVPSSGSTYTYGFVYDKAIPAACQPVPVASSGTSHPASTPNYTLLFDNFHANGKDSDGMYIPADTQDDVYVAVEFQNNTGVSFYGNASLIEDGGYFYLIGKLDPDNVTTAPAWPSGYKVPPYTVTGDSQKIPRVFIQDFMTKVTFTLGENSLKYAYLTVPDLRASSMTLGLSVDLTWKSGLDFGDVVLGGD